MVGGAICGEEDAASAAADAVVAGAAEADGGGGGALTGVGAAGEHPRVATALATKQFVRQIGKMDFVCMVPPLTAPSVLDHDPNKSNPEGQPRIPPHGFQQNLLGGRWSVASRHGRRLNRLSPPSLGGEQQRISANGAPPTRGPPQIGSVATTRGPLAVGRTQRRATSYFQRASVRMRNTVATCSRIL